MIIEKRKHSALDMTSSVKRRTKNRDYKCVVCGKRFGRNRMESRILCSIECKRVRSNKQRRHWAKTETGLLSNYKSSTKQQIKIYNNKKLCLRYKESLIRSQLLLDRLKEATTK